MPCSPGTLDAQACMWHAIGLARNVGAVCPLLCFCRPDDGCAALRLQIGNYIHDGGNHETALLDHDGIGEGCHCPGGLCASPASSLAPDQPCDLGALDLAQ